MVIQVDTREKKRAIQKILLEFERKETLYFVSKLPVGDYMNLDNPRLVVDRKQNLLELCKNVCQDFPRFRDELKRARKYGIKLVFLCEQGGSIKDLQDVISWVNPRLKKSPMAMSGERLYRVLSALSEEYGVSFLFCSKNETGRRIVELLEKGLE